MSLATRSVGAQEALAAPQQTGAADQSSVHINLKPQQIAATYTGAAQVNQTLLAGQAQPLSMASGDFDGDGVADLVTGYAAPGGGVLSLYRGNSEAINPRKPENIQGLAEGRFPAPFVGKARTFISPEAPSFLATGDFNQDGRPDVLTAARGSNNAYVLLGNGQGGLSFAQSIVLRGQVTALLTGDVGAQDGLADVAVAVLGPAGPAVLVYEGASAGLWGEPMIYPLQAEATAMALGQLNAYGATDLAVASGNQVVVIHSSDDAGESTLATLGSLAQMQRINFPFVVKSLIVGDFIGDRDQRMELALLAADGSVHMMTRGTLDRRPFTEAEKQARYEALESPQRNQSARANISAGVTEQWIQADSLSATASVSGNVSSQALLTAAKVSGQSTPDLMVLDPANNRLQILPLVQHLSKDEVAAQVLPNEHRTSVAFDVGGAPLAVLPMKLNVDGKTDLVVLNEGQVAPVAVPSVINATFQVTKTADTFDGACNADCSLREAIQAANNNGVGTSDMITFAVNGTFQLTIATSGEGNFSGNEGIRDLDIIDGDLTIVGSSPANTIIQAGTTASTNGTNGDGISRVFHVNPDPSDHTFDTTFQNLTIRNGKQAASATAGLAGGIFFDGFNTTNNTTDGTLTVSNCVITANYCSLDGGGIWADNGQVTVNSGSVISNNVTGAGDGGGIFHSSAHNVSITGSTISGNTAHDDVTGTTDPSNIAQFGQGGGVRLGGSTRATISSTTISSNIADKFDGGGVYIPNPITIDSNSVIQGNTAGRDGGGIYSDQVASTPAAEHDILTSVTIKDNTATRNGGGIYKGRGTLDINGCTIGSSTAGENNAAVLGGGIYASPSTAGAGENGTLNFISNASSIVGNTATTSGGGLYIANKVSPAATMTVNFNVGSTIGGSTSAHGNSAPTGGGIQIDSGTLNMSTGSSVIQNNKATGNGGGLAAIGGTITLNGVTFKGNKADNDANSSGDGGAIFSSGGAFTVGNTSAVTIGGTAAGEPNTARNGGGIAISGGSFTMTGGSINGNTASANGGGVLTSVGTTFNSAVSVTNNMAGGTGGGFNFTGGSTAINGAASITGNTATGNGGGIFNNGGTITLPNSATIGGAAALKNTAANGGGIFNQSGSLTMTGGSLTGNSATADGGGANMSGGTLTFASGVSITGNTANVNGGGLAGSGGTLNVNGGGVIQSNVADNDANNTGNGGGIYNNGSTILLPNSTTIGGAGGLKNQARNGGGISSNAGSLTMTGGTLTGNQSSADGGGLFTSGGSATFNGVTPINNNTATGNGGGVAHTGGTSNINNATITGNTATGNGGAFFNNGAGLTASLNRIVNNTAASGTGIFNQSGTPLVENNWWGCDGFPNTGGCQTAAGPAVGSVDSDPRIDLVLTATPSTINPGGTSTLKADFSKNSSGTTINPVVMNGLTVTFASDSLGSVAPTSGTIASLMATTTYTAGSSAGLSTVTAQVDNPPAASTQVTIQANADLQVTKMADVNQVLRGNNITYTINFKNNGPTNDPNVTVTDTVPTNTTFVSATITSSSSSGWTISTQPAVGGTGNVVFSNPDVPNQATAVFTVVVKVNAGAPIGATITNNAVAAGFPVDPTPGNNTGTAMTTVIAIADLQILKSDSPDPVSSGANITYTLDLTNLGPDPAQNVTVSDSTPTNTTLVSVTTPAGWMRTDSVPVGGTGAITFSKTADLANNGTAQFLIVVKVNSSVAAGVTISNTATTASTTNDPDSNNNTAMADTLTQTRADIQVTKTDSPDPVTAGNNLTYTVTITNAGPSDAQGVQLTDSTPTNTTFVSEQQDSGPAFNCTNPTAGTTGTTTCTIGTLTAGSSAVFKIVVKVGASTPSGTHIMNSATGSTTTTDPTPGNDTGQSDTTVNTSADIGLTKTDSPDPVTAGNNLTYTVTITNTGPSDAQNVQLTDSTPTNTTFVSEQQDSGPTFNCTNPTAGTTGTVTCSIGTLAVGDSAVFKIIVKVDANTPDGTVITNTANKSSDTSDPNNANDAGTAMTTVNTSADLAVTKSASPDPGVSAGNSLTYTITITNQGPSDAQGLGLSDPLPANTTLVSFSVPAGWTRTDAVPMGGTGTVTATAPSLAKGDSAQFTLVVTVNLNTPHGTVITNEATASTTTTDPDPLNNKGTAMTTVNAQANLALTKADLADPVMLGANINYHLVVTNNGPGNAEGVVLTDKLATTAVYVSATPSAGSCMQSAGTVTCNLGNIANGAMATVDIVIQSTGNPGTISDTASVVSNVTDPDTSDNKASETTRTVGFRKFSFLPTSVTGGCDSSTGTLLFTSGAPAGVTINFTDGGAPSVDPIASVTTVGGETSIPVVANTQIVTAEVIVNITASSGSNSIVGRLKITPVRITSLTFNPNPVMGGQVTTGTVTLTCPAPKDILVRLSYDKALAKPDVTSFTILTGETSGQFTITTKHPLSQTVATITASANGGFVRSTLTVTP
jgi:CSLREA domain-containing protein/uncharacterized repeat protein (TIGR01451 family)